jgi:hypothetical protein
MSTIQMIDGNSHGGALQHVRGCQALLQPALSALSDPEEHDLAVFLLESHGYFAIMAILCGEEDNNVRAMAIDFCRHTLSRIRKSPAFGTMFAYEPQAIVYTSQLLQILHDHRGEQLSPAQKTELQAMRQNISMGQSPLTNGTDEDNKPDKQKVTIVCFKAAVLTLHADSLLGPTLTANSLQPQIATAMGLLQLLHKATDTCYGLVPYLMSLGSYVQEPAAQQRLHAYLKSFTSEMPLQQRAVQLLEWHWADATDTLVGPRAIQMTAMTHSVSAYLC